MPTKWSLLLIRFRFQATRQLRIWRPKLSRWIGTVRKQAPPVLRAAVALPLWWSYEFYHWCWRKTEAPLSARVGWLTLAELRLLFCWLLSSLFAFVGVLWLGLPLWFILLGSIHGVVMHGSWWSGRRWSRRALGFRPGKSFDPQKPFAGLDLGN